MSPETKRARVDHSTSKQIYMDYNATTPLSTSVIRVITEALTNAWQNPSSLHPGGLKAKQLISDSRQHIAKMVNGSEEEIIFMSGGTESNNHVILNCIEYFKEFTKANEMFRIRKPHFITSTIEHDSIAKILKHLAERNEIEVTLIKVKKELGHVSAEDVLQNIQDNTVLVSIMMANNETGTIQPIKKVTTYIQRLKESRIEKFQPNVFIHTDAAQTIGKIKVDVQDLGVDYLTIVGHKFYGPRIGALWARNGTPYAPMFYGGGQEAGKRAGTENTCMIVGLGEAARLVHENLEEYNEHMTKIKSYLKDQLTETFQNQVLFNGSFCDALPNTLNVSIIGDIYQGRTVLNQCSYLQASVGAACHSDKSHQPSLILLEHGVPKEIASNAIRLSVGRETSKEDIDLVVKDMKQAVDKLSDLGSFN